MKISSLAVAAVLAAAPWAAQAQVQAQAIAPHAAGDWVIDARVSDVSSDAKDPITNGAGAATGLHVAVGDSVMPTLGFTYYLTDKFAVEAILGTTHHTIRAEGAGVSEKVHDTWVLPPVVSLQYHPLPAARFSPYVGAGVNGMIFYSGHNQNGFTVKLQDRVGFALQAGADYALTGPWSLNADVKKVFVHTNATIDGGALVSDVNLSPWVVSLGVGRRF